MKSTSQRLEHEVGPDPNLTADPAKPLAVIAPLYLRPEQAVQVLPISRRTLSNWQARRLIKFYRVGRTVLFKRTDIEAALEKFAVLPIGTPRPRKPAETSTIPSEPVTPRKRRAVRIVPPTDGKRSEP